VAGLIALVGVLACRWLFNIPILAPRHDGAYGDAHTTTLILVPALAALPWPTRYRAPLFKQIAAEADCDQSPIRPGGRPLNWIDGRRSGGAATAHV
jgi:hypothetical protein